MENQKEGSNRIETENAVQYTNTCDIKINDNVNQETSELNLNMSKRQLKKVKKREKWLERKVEKRLREREKVRQKRAFARANNIDLGPSRKALKKSTMADSSCKVAVTIDMSFDDLMIDKDVAKVTKQILRCYALNRRAIAPMQFSLTSFNGKARVDMQKHNGYEHWDVKFYIESYLDVYPKEEIIYLTSESENVITHLEHDCVYIIGGLVDHNSHKGLCHNLAKQAGVRHGRLPLDEFLQMKARKVLTIDHVFEILLRVSEGKTWQEAFLQVLPERKNAQPILSSGEKKDTLDMCNKRENIFHANHEIEIKLDANESENSDMIQIKSHTNGEGEAEMDVHESENVHEIEIKSHTNGKVEAKIKDNESGNTYDVCT